MDNALNRILRSKFHKSNNIVLISRQVWDEYAENISGFMQALIDSVSNTSDDTFEYMDSTVVRHINLSDDNCTMVVQFPEES